MNCRLWHLKMRIRLGLLRIWKAFRLNLNINWYLHAYYNIYRKLVKMKEIDLKLGTYQDWKKQGNTRKN
jgi:hypothetical protein